MKSFSMRNARTIAEVASENVTVADAMKSADPNDAFAVVKAGGIDLLDLMKENLLAPATIVNLRDIPGLDTIADISGRLRIGSMVTLASVAAHPLVRRRAPILAAAASAAASPQIRNVATLGGNLLQRPRCWYFRSKEFHCLKKGGDHCYARAGQNQYHAIFDNRHCAIVHPSTAATVLVALDARVELIDATGTARTLRLEDFLVSPSVDATRENNLAAREILTAVELPSLPASSRTAYLKLGEKESFDWPLAEAAVVLDFDSDRRCTTAAIVLGAAAPLPHRARASEAALRGEKIDEKLARAAASMALDGATPLSKNEYKLPLFETLVRRAILAAVE